MKKDPKNRPILVLDEDAETLESMLEPLRWEGYDVRGFTSTKEATEFMSYWRPQMIILNPDFSNEDGLAYLNSLSDYMSTTSIVVVSGNVNAERVSQCLDLGVSDYIKTPFADAEFLARVRAQIRLRDQKEELQIENEKLQELIQIDDLTGLYNMRSIYQKLEFEMERGKRFNRPVTVVMLDMDKFKSVNDGHDHLFGSFVLGEVGKIIKASTRTVDIPARYGGDEFLIVLSEIPLSGIEQFCERLRQRIENSVFTHGRDSIKLTVSIGFATTQAGESITARELTRRADMALYQAKREGRNRIQFYTPAAERPERVLGASAVIDIFDKKRKTA